MWVPLHPGQRARVGAAGRLRPWLLALAMLAALLDAGPVQAHARLLKSKPAADATLSASPPAIVLWFNEAPEIDFSTIKVLDDADKVFRDLTFTDD